MSDRTIEAHGRTITVSVSDGLDEYGQFLVVVVVDGKERWSAHFNDRADPTSREQQR